MNSINQAITGLNSGIDAVVAYIQANGMAILALLAVAYFFRSSVAANPVLAANAGAGGGHVLSASSAASTNATSRGEELRQVRLRQQELANQRAKEAEKIRKEKEAAEKDRKNHVAKKRPTGGDTLGRGSSGGGYNPMQPWTSQTSGYRPARRTVNRGGG